MTSPHSTFPPELTLYYSPKACSLASHIALEESGLPYGSVAIDIRAGANTQPEYLRLNPGGTVPALGVGDRIVTESHAILSYVSDLAAERCLLPRHGTIARARAHEWMNWISSSMHAAYRSIFRPQAYAGDESPSALDAVREHGRQKLSGVLLDVERRLEGATFALGPHFSSVDAYLFVFYLWSFDERIAAELPDRPRYRALAQRVWERPAVRKVVDRERSVRAYAMPPGFIPSGEEAR